MDRKQFMEQLERLLSDISEAERQEETERRKEEGKEGVSKQKGGEK